MYCMMQHHLTVYDTRFSGHIVTGKICGLMLADIVDFHMILLLRKQCLQIGIMIVLLYTK